MHLAYPQQPTAAQYSTNASLPGSYPTTSQNAYPPPQGGAYPSTQGGVYPSSPPPGYTPAGTEELFVFCCVVSVISLALFSYATTRATSTTDSPCSPTNCRFIHNIYLYYYN